MSAAASAKEDQTSVRSPLTASPLFPLPPLTAHRSPLPPSPSHSYSYSHSYSKILLFRKMVTFRVTPFLYGHLAGELVFIIVLARWPIVLLAILRTVATRPIFDLAILPEPNTEAGFPQGGHITTTLTRVGHLANPAGEAPNTILLSHCFHHSSLLILFLKISLPFEAFFR